MCQDLLHHGRYTFTAIDPVAKLMPCWLMGTRTAQFTQDFVQDLASRLANRIQLTSDGFPSYPDAVERANMSMHMEMRGLRG